MALRGVTIAAPAKVNLILRVLDLDESIGFHQLETVFQAVELHDELDLDATVGGVGLEVVGADLGPERDNLVTRAARLFFQDAGVDGGVDVRLVKRIPHGAGLGGGSSDAAATLKALNVLFATGLGPERLADLGARLGSDVAFFLGQSTTALGLGRGERIQPLSPLPVAPMLIAVPEARVATAGAYRALDLHREVHGVPSRTPLTTELAPVTWSRMRRLAENDFEPIISKAEPSVAALAETIRETGPEMAQMSGSGSAVFATYSSARVRDVAVRVVSEAGWTVWPTETSAAFPGVVPDSARAG